jgi:hypothetical protein
MKGYEKWGDDDKNKDDKNKKGGQINLYTNVTSTRIKDKKARKDITSK